MNGFIKSIKQFTTWGPHLYGYINLAPPNQGSQLGSSWVQVSICKFIYTWGLVLIRFKPRSETHKHTHTHCCLFHYNMHSNWGTLFWTALLLLRIHLFIGDIYPDCWPMSHVRQIHPSCLWVVPLNHLYQCISPFLSSIRPTYTYIFFILYTGVS